MCPDNVRQTGDSDAATSFCPWSFSWTALDQGSENGGTCCVGSSGKQAKAIPANRRTTKYVMPGQLRWLRHLAIREIHILVVRKRGSIGLVRLALVLHRDFACPPKHERTPGIRDQILKLARTLDGIEDDLQFGSHGDSHEGRLRAATRRKGPPALQVSVWK